MNEIVVISGKGGTGKSSLVASMLAYLDSVVIADCDVDAPDLHLLLKGTTISDVPFYGLERPQLVEDSCIACGLCKKHCQFGCDPKNTFFMDNCEGCGVCDYVCPTDAIQMKKVRVGQLIHHHVHNGEFTYGRLIPGEETSGKLVAAVRRKAKELAKEKNIPRIIIDGAPGIACNVISSVTGANHAIIVTEPSLSGLHDLKRVHELIKDFQIEISIVINKVDLSAEAVNQIRHYCDKEDLLIVLEIPYNKNIVESINKLILPPRYDQTFYDEIKFSDFLKRIDCL